MYNQVGIGGVQLQSCICAILTSCSRIFHFHEDLVTYMEYYLQYITGNLAPSLKSVTSERRTSGDVRDIHLILIIQCTFFSVGRKTLGWTGTNRLFELGSFWSVSQVVDLRLPQDRLYITYQTQKTVFDHTLHSRVILINFEVFGDVVKHSLQCLIYLLNQN